MPRVSRSAASLRFVGDDLDPDEITRRIGRSPNLAQRRGEAVLMPNGGQRIVPRGMWSIEVDDTEPADLGSQVLALLKGTTDDLSVWRDLASRFRAEIFWGIFLKGGNEGLPISPTTLILLGERGLTLDLDIYGNEFSSTPVRRSNSASRG